MVPRVALVSCELRAALVRSGWAGAPQRGRENGEKVVRERGALMKTNKAKYYDESLEFL